MGQIGSVDPYALVRLAVAVFLVACVGVLALMRDRRSAPERLVTGSVRCPQRRESAVVTFVERMRTGLMTRRVESCSLLDVGERCDQECADASSAKVAIT